MKKKILPIIIILALIAIGAILVVKFMKKGPAEKSLMETAKEQGQEIMSKNEWISECRKSSDQESKDMCYSMAAFYYRDSGLCKEIKDAEMKKGCNRENIEKWYQELEEGKVSPRIFGMPGYPTGTGFPGVGVPPLEVISKEVGEREEEVEYEEGEEEKIEEPIDTGKMNDDIYVEIEGYTYYLAMLYAEKPVAAAEVAGKIEKKRNELLKKYGVTDEQVEAYGNEINKEADKGNFSRMMTIMERTQTRVGELREKGL